MRKRFWVSLVLAVTALNSCTKKSSQANSSSVDSTSFASETGTDTAAIETLTPFGIQVTITEKAMDTFVISESYSIDVQTGEKVLHSDTVSDTERRLRVLRKDEVLVDTLLRKEAFKYLFQEDVMDNFVFGKYEVTKVSADTVEFFGVVGEPNSDFAVVAFKHYFDVRTKAFSIEVLEFEDEEDEDRDE